MNKIKMSTMMFLEFFVWGAWYVTVGIYMAEIGMEDEIYWAFTVGPIAAIVSPFFLGMIADRFFATERVLGFLHIIGGLAMIVAAIVSTTGNATLFLVMLQIHMLCYMPTIGLANSLAFHHMKSQENEFPIIRAFGTIGWIVAGVLVGYVLSSEKTAIPLQIAGAGGILMGLFSFALPHTPPPAAGQKANIRQILGLDALARLKSKPFNVFILCSLLTCIPLAVYYSYAPVFVAQAGITDPATKMAFGQISEAVFIFMMPFFFARLGVKWMLLTGMFAWVLRYAFFALGASDAITWMILTGIILHGVCYDFFFVAGQIYVDKKASKDIRGQAQGLIVLVTYGVGMLIGAQVSGIVYNEIVDTSSPDALSQFQKFWFLPSIFAALVMVTFGMLFKDRLANSAEEEGAKPEISAA